MSVREITLKNGWSGESYKAWRIDVRHTYPDGRRVRVQQVAQVQNRRGAEREEHEIVVALANGTYIKPRMRPAGAPRTPAASGAPSFKDFAKEFVDTYAATNNKPSEVESKRSILKNHLQPAFGAMRLDEIKVADIERYKAAKLKAKCSAKTINNHLTVLRKMLALANEWERLDVVPRVKWLKVAAPEFRFLTFDEADALIAKAGDWSAFIITAVRTGLRVGELLALRWCDVDLTNGRVIVRRSVTRGIIGTPKSGKGREVPLCDEALRALTAHRHLRGELVFCTDAGKMLARSGVKWPIYSACRRANIERIGVHVLRHTFASHLVMRGAPLKAVQELLGHASMAVTMRYAHLSPDARRDAVRLLDGQGARRVS